MTIALSITHAAHIPERTEVFARNREAMQEAHFCFSHLETHEGPWPEWAQKQWEWGAWSGAEHVCFLQDDSVCCPDFYATLTAAVAAKPSEIICLFHGTSMRAAAVEARSRGLSWLTSSDEMVGIGYVMPTARLEDFLRWKKDVALPSLPMDMHNAEPRLGEDTLLAIWAMNMGQRIWHPVPALVEHDTAAKSTWGNPDTTNAVGLGHGGKPIEVNWDTEALHVGRLRAGTYRHLLLGTNPKAWKDCKTVERFYAMSGNR